MTETQLRIAVIGDELVAGVGDPKGLGWLGRVIARTHTGVTTMAFPLAVPGETTTEMSARWEDEVIRRSSNDPDVDHRLVIGLGIADITAGLSVARSRLNLANILDLAEQRKMKTFVVGPLHVSPIYRHTLKSCPMPTRTLLIGGESPTSIHSTHWSTTISGIQTLPSTRALILPKPGTG